MNAGNCVQFLVISLAVTFVSTISGCGVRQENRSESPEAAAIASSENGADAESKSMPNLTASGERFEFGVVAAGDVIKHGFVFTNTWNRPVRIEKIQSACDCTAVEPPNAAIEPGSSTVIRAVLQTKGKSGPVRVGFACELDNGATIEYRFVGFVSPSELKKIAFGRTQRGSKKRYQVTLPVLIDHPWTVERTKVLGKVVQVTLAESIAERFVFDVTVAADASYGAFADTITFETTDQYNPTKSVVAEGYIEFPVEVEPVDLALGIVDKETPAQANVRVYSPYGKTVVLRSIEQVGGAAMSWTTNDISDSVKEIMVQAKPRVSKDPVYSAELTISALVDEELFLRTVRVYGLDSTALASK